MFCSYGIFNHVVTAFVHQVPRLSLLNAPLEQLLPELPENLRQYRNFMDKSYIFQSVASIDILHLLCE
jgi:hypothetical protein